MASVHWAELHILAIHARFVLKGVKFLLECDVSGQSFPVVSRNTPLSLRVDCQKDIALLNIRCRDIIEPVQDVFFNNAPQCLESQVLKFSGVSDKRLVSAFGNGMG